MPPSPPAPHCIAPLHANGADEVLLPEPPVFRGSGDVGEFTDLRPGGGGVGGLRITAPHAPAPPGEGAGGVRWVGLVSRGGGGLG